jgi:glycosyltransferase involved in cell wall biosynthesis
MEAQLSAPIVSWPRVSIVISTLNWARNLPHISARLPVDIHEVIAVDGNSVDDTETVARQFRLEVRIVRQMRKDKGNALSCGFATASGDIIATVDADGSADPTEIPRFVKALLDGDDFAEGMRRASNAGRNDLERLYSRSNRLLGSVVNICYGTRYPDLYSGFSIFWRRHAPVFRLDATSPRPPMGEWLYGDGFEVEALIHIRVDSAGLIITEVPISKNSRIHETSNVSAVKDGWKVLEAIERDRLGGSSLGRAGVTPFTVLSIHSLIECPWFQ